MYADQDSEHFQRERSEARFFFHERVWVDLPTNEFSRGYSSPSFRNLSVNCYDMKIREGERQMGTFEPFKDTQEEDDLTRDADVSHLTVGSKLNSIKDVHSI